MRVFCLKGPKIEPILGVLADISCGPSDLLADLFFCFYRPITKNLGVKVRIYDAGGGVFGENQKKMAIIFFQK